MPRPTRIIIDTDIALGIADRDVDDGLALTMAHNSPTLALVAVTLTYGNANLKEVVTSMENLNAFLKIPTKRIAVGAENSQALGKSNPAVELIIKCLEKQSHAIVALGPLTNIATLKILRPDLLKNIEKIVVVAGRRPRYRFLTGNYTLSHPDLNFEKDPSAMATLLEADVPIVFAPYELSSKVWLEHKHLQQVRENGTSLSEYLYKNCLPWLKMWQERFSTADQPICGFNPFDCLAISCLIDSDLIASKPVKAIIEQDHYDQSDEFVQGSGSALKPYLHVYPAPDSKQLYTFSIASEKFLPRMVKLLR